MCVCVKPGSLPLVHKEIQKRWLTNGKEIPGYGKPFHINLHFMCDYCVPAYNRERSPKQASKQ